MTVVFGYAPPGIWGGEIADHEEAIEELGEKVLGKARAQAAACGIEIETELVPKRAVPALLDVAEERDARMIVVGSFGEAPLKGIILGSTTNKLLHLTDTAGARGPGGGEMTGDRTDARPATPPSSPVADSPSVALRNVTKRFDTFTAVDDLSLELGQGEFFTLLGPSGCGKTTTLRMIAGFEQPTEGEIAIEGENVDGTPPHKRPTNTVFQSYALFPHLSVEKNVAFGLKRKGVGKDEIAERVAPSCSGSGWRARRTGGRRSSPAACSSGSRWRGRWSTCRRCCCSTSRSARST